MVDIHRWVSLVLVSLRVILTQSKEEVVLGRLQQLGLTTCFTEEDVNATSQKPAAVDAAQSSNPDRTFARSLRLHRQMRN